MKIMLQGFLYEANFGDILAADLFYSRCQKSGFESVDFYQHKNLGIGSFCRKQLGYTKEKSTLSCFAADAFVIISGGSFWNDGKRPKDAGKRYRTFILPALIYQALGKPVYVLGVGGGAVDTPWLRKKMVKLLNKAKVVTFRDEHTKKVFSEYGVKNEMAITADSVLVLKKEMLESLEEKTELEQAAGGRKKILLHLPDGPMMNAYVTDLVVPGLVRFLKEHPEYYLVISNDNIRTLPEREVAQLRKTRAAFAEAGIEFYDYQYHDSRQMCSLIAEMDCVVTSKLHVGVVASALEKCVISFPVHREKTDNFYQMIGESKRCMNVRILDTEKAYNQICKYHDKPVHISEELRKRAELNLSVLDDIAAGKI